MNINIFPPGVFLGLGVLACFAPWGIFGLGSISTFWTISNLYVLNCFKYFLIQILRQKVSKLDKKDFELYHLFTHNFLCQNDKLFIKMFELYLVFLCQNVSILPLCTTDALKVLLYKNWPYFFFLSSDMDHNCLFCEIRQGFHDAI